MTPTLYHYTCEHGAERIRADGYLVRTMMGLAWFTDLDVPFREALGLTNRLTKCDRTAVRFQVVDPSGIIPWHVARRQFPRAASVLEDAPGVMPAHWFVSQTQVRVQERRS